MKRITVIVAMCLAELGTVYAQVSRTDHIPDSCRPGTFYINNRERNPDQGGWVADSADIQSERVYIGRGAMVCGFAVVGDNARISGSAVVRGNARVGAHADIGGASIVEGNAQIGGGGYRSQVMGRSIVSGSTVVRGSGADVTLVDMVVSSGEFTSGNWDPARLRQEAAERSRREREAQQAAETERQRRIQEAQRRAEEERYRNSPAGREEQRRAEAVRSREIARDEIQRLEREQRRLLETVRESATPSRRERGLRVRGTIFSILATGLGSIGLWMIVKGNKNDDNLDERPFWGGTCDGSDECSWSPSMFVGLSLIGVAAWTYFIVALNEPLRTAGHWRDQRHTTLNQAQEQLLGVASQIARHRRTLQNQQRLSIRLSLSPHLSLDANFPIQGGLARTTLFF